MDTNTKEIGTAVVPVMRYRDLPAAIDWLCKAFGFERHRVTGGTNGDIMFAQLTFGTAMIMLGPVRQSAFDQLLKQPDEVGGAETQVCYFFVADARAHCARARAAGAEIVFNIEDEGRGGASYSCRDPEGHLWNFGTYNPWQRQAIVNGPRDGRGPFRRFALVPVAFIALAVSIVVAGGPSGEVQQILMGLSTKGLLNASPEDAKTASDQLARGRSAAVERPAEEIEEQRLAVEAALRLVREAREQLARALRDKEVAEQAAGDAQGRLANALIEKDAVEQASKELQERLARLWISKNAVERAAWDVRRQLARERSARKAAESAQARSQTRSGALSLSWP